MVYHIRESVMLVQHTCFRETLFTHEATEWVFMLEFLFMLFQTYWVWKSVFTQGAAKWFVILVNLFMLVQHTHVRESLFTHSRYFSLCRYLGLLLTFLKSLTFLVIPLLFLEIPI